jgi:Ni,Fe-hydrogenase I cytochrome b subunit
MLRRGYPTAFKAILICYGLVVIVAMVLRVYLTFVNNTRDRQELLFHELNPG